MTALGEEARRYLSTKRQAEQDARQTAAFFLASGIDLAWALGAAPEEKAAIRLRLRRLLERERLKGAARHWSYDINRHIALKQVLDRLEGKERTPPDAEGLRTGILRVRPTRHARRAGVKTERTQ